MVGKEDKIGVASLDISIFEENIYLERRKKKQWEQ